MSSVLRRTIAIGVVVSLAVLAGCGGDDGGGESSSGEGGGDGPVEMKVAFGIPGEEIKYVMMERPDLAPNQGTCYTVEWTELAGNVNAVQALTVGTVDGATAGGLAGAQGIIAGGDMVIIGQFIEERSGYFSTAWVTKADSGIDSLADIEGRIVANSGVGSSTNIIEVYHLEQEAGLVAGQDYEAVEIPFGQQQENLESGRIDVGVFPQPFFDRLMASGDYKVLWRVSDVADPFVQLTQAFSRDFVEANPDAVRCFVDDFEAVAEWIADPENRDEVIEITAEVSGLDASLLDSFLLTETDFYRPEAGALSVEALQANWDFFYEAGEISEELTVTDYVVEEFSAGSAG